MFGKRTGRIGLFCFPVTVYYFYMSYERRYRKGFEYVEKMHRGQFRAGKSPVWQHLLRVSEILRSVLAITGEGSSKEKFDIYFSALGHDLLEDTSAQRADLKKIFGPQGLDLIDGMTNDWGDQEKPRYIKKVCKSDEAVRLIKLADLIDNYFHVGYSINLLGLKWTGSFFLPIVVPMSRALTKTKFKKFKKTTALLSTVLDIGIKNLDAEIAELT